MGKKTYIAIVLDRSGSMKSCRDATLLGVNKQISTIRKDAKEPGNETFVSYYTFNAQVEPKYKCRPVNFLDDIAEYEIGGNTAIYDAMGTAITDFDRETDVSSADNSYLIVFVSDGKEYPVGCSKKFTARQIAKMVKDKQDTGRWTFTYMGANQDLGKLQAELGLYRGNIANYASDMKGAAVAWENNSRQLGNYLKLRKRGTTALKSFHTNDEGAIADYTKVDMNAIARDFDHTKLILEKAKPGETADLDTILKLRPEKDELPKSIFQRTQG